MSAARSTRLPGLRRARPRRLRAAAHHRRRLPRLSRALPLRRTHSRPLTRAVARPRLEGAVAPAADRNDIAGHGIRTIHQGDPRSPPAQRGDRRTGDGRAPARLCAEFCLLLAELEPARFRRAIARWHALFVLEAPRITVEESVLAVSAAQALAGTQRLTAAYTLQRLANAHGLSAVAAVLRELSHKGMTRFATYPRSPRVVRLTSVDGGASVVMCDIRFPVSPCDAVTMTLSGAAAAGSASGSTHMYLGLREIGTIEPDSTPRGAQVWSIKCKANVDGLFLTRARWTQPQANQRPLLGWTRCSVFTSQERWAMGDLRFSHRRSPTQVCRFRGTAKRNPLGLDPSAAQGRIHDRP